MVDDHLRRARICGESVRLCAGHGGRSAPEMAGGRLGAGGGLLGVKM